MLTYPFMKFHIANAVEIVPAFELEGLSSGAMQSSSLPGPLSHPSTFGTGRADTGLGTGEVLRGPPSMRGNSDYNLNQDLHQNAAVPVQHCSCSSARRQRCNEPGDFNTYTAQP